MRRTILVGLTLASALLSACRGSSPKEGAPAAPTAALEVSDPSGAAGPFALDALERLVIQVEVANVQPGSHKVRVDVTGPGGTLYAQLPTTVVASEQGQAHATSLLQVRGSVIESYRQTGTWQLVAAVDGTALASAAVDLTE